MTEKLLLKEVEDNHKLELGHDSYFNSFIRRKYEAVEKELRKELGDQPIANLENRLKQYVKKGPTGNKIEHYVFDDRLLLEVELVGVDGLFTWVFRKPARGDASGIVVVN